MRLVPIQPVSNKTIYEYGTDGTNIYLLSLLDPNTVAESIKSFEHNLTAEKGSPLPKPKAPNKPVNQATALITRGGFPLVDVGFADVIWFALASQSYFREFKSDKMLALSPLRISSARHPLTSTNLLKVKWSLLNTDLTLPNEVTFLHQGNRFELNKESDDFKTFTLPKPWDKGYRIGHYRVVETTNWFGSTFPKRFELTRFSVSYTNKDEHAVSRLTGIVDSYNKEVTIAAFIPNTSMVTLVWDNRIRIGPRETPATYLRTNLETWPSTNEVLHSAAYRRQLKTEMKRAQAEQTGWMSVRFFIASGVTTIALIILVWQLQKNKSNKTRKKT